MLVDRSDSSQFKISSYNHFLLCSSQQFFEVSILMTWHEENKTRTSPRQKWHWIQISWCQIAAFIYFIVLLMTWSYLRIWNIWRRRGKRILNQKVCRPHSKSDLSGIVSSQSWVKYLFIIIFRNNLECSILSHFINVQIYSLHIMTYYP